MDKKTELYIEGHVENIEKGKELLDKLKVLSDEYKTTIDLKIYQDPQEFDTQM